MAKRIRLTMVLGAVAGLAVTTIVLTSSSASSASPITPLADSQALAIGKAVATGFGDSTPIEIQHARGARSQANLVGTGDNVPSDQASILIAERGRFTVARPLAPPNAHGVITGSVLTLVVDATTGRVTDFAVSDRYPTMSALGAVTTDVNTTATVARAHKGTLIGSIVFAGGPPRPHHKRPIVGGTVSVYRGSQLVAKQRVRTGRHFRFSLDPGGYQLRLPRTASLDCPPTYARVRAGHTSTVEVPAGCSIP